MFFNLHVFGGFPIFFLTLISSFIVLCSENMHGMILIFLYLLRAYLQPSVWSILENVPCSLKKNVYSASLGWNVLNISVKSISSSVSFKAIVSLLIFYLDLTKEFESTKTFLKEIKTVIIRKHSVFVGIRLNVRMPTLPKAIYRFNAISSKIPTVLFVKVDEPMFKFIWYCKEPWIAKTILKTKKRSMLEV